MQADADLEAVARLLVGAAPHQAFLAVFWDDGSAGESGLAQRLVAPVVPGLLTA